MNNTFLKLFKRETSNGEHLAFVDGIRFVAVFLVVFFHLQPYFIQVFETADNSFLHLILAPIYQYGYRGVDIFFVLSGFVIGYNHLQYSAKNGKNQSVISFYKRRFYRIYPPFFVVILLIYVGNTILIPQFSHSELLPSFLSTCLYVNTITSGFYQMTVLSNVTWTLEIEIQFYVLFPLIFIYLYKITSKIRVWFFLILIFLFTLLKQLFPFNIVTLYDYLPLFLAGMLFADLYFRGIKLPLRNQWFIGGCSILLFYTIIISFYNINIYSYYNYIYPFLILTFFLLLTENKVLQSGFVCAVGGMCYSIYLIHTPVIGIMNRVIDQIGLLDAYYLPTQILVIILASSTFYLLVEKPFMSKKLRS